MSKKLFSLSSVFIFMTASPLYAAADGEVSVLGLSLAAGLAIGIAAMGGALGQGKAVSAALEGIARNPNASGRIFTPMIIGLALIESLVIYGLVIAFILQGNIAPLLETITG